MGSMHQIRDGVAAEIRSKLIELQGSRTDAEMAGVLGITRSHWAHIRGKRRSVTYAIVKRASAEFPKEILPMVVNDLSGVA